MKKIVALSKENIFDLSLKMALELQNKFNAVIRDPSLLLKNAASAKNHLNEYLKSLSNQKTKDLDELTQEAYIALAKSRFNTETPNDKHIAEIKKDLEKLKKEDKENFSLWLDIQQTEKSKAVEKIFSNAVLKKALTKKTAEMRAILQSPQDLQKLFTQSLELEKDVKDDTSKIAESDTIKKMKDNIKKMEEEVNSIIDNQARSKKVEEIEAKKAEVDKKIKAMAEINKDKIKIALSEKIARFLGENPIPSDPATDGSDLLAKLTATILDIDMGNPAEKDSFLAKLKDYKADKSYEFDALLSCRDSSKVRQLTADVVRDWMLEDRIANIQTALQTGQIDDAWLVSQLIGTTDPAKINDYLQITKPQDLAERVAKKQIAAESGLDADNPTEITRFNRDIDLVNKIKTKTDELEALKDKYNNATGLKRIFKRRRIRKEIERLRKELKTLFKDADNAELKDINSRYKTEKRRGTRALIRWIRSELQNTKIAWAENWVNGIPGIASTPGQQSANEENLYRLVAMKNKIDPSDPQAYAQFKAQIKQQKDSRTAYVQKYKESLIAKDNTPNRARDYKTEYDAIRPKTLLDEWESKKPVDKKADLTKEAKEKITKYQTLLQQVATLTKTSQELNECLKKINRLGNKPELIAQKRNLEAKLSKMNQENILEAMTLLNERADIVTKLNITPAKPETLKDPKAIKAQKIAEQEKAIKEIEKEIAEQEKIVKEAQDKLRKGPTDYRKKNQILQQQKLEKMKKNKEGLKTQLESIKARDEKKFREDLPTEREQHLQNLKDLKPKAEEYKKVSKRLKELEESIHKGNPQNPKLAQLVNERDVIKAQKENLEDHLGIRKTIQTIEFFEQNKAELLHNIATLRNLQTGDPRQIRQYEQQLAQLDAELTKNKAKRDEILSGKPAEKEKSATVLLQARLKQIETKLNAIAGIEETEEIIDKTAVEALIKVCAEEKLSNQITPNMFFMESQVSDKLTTVNFEDIPATAKGLIYASLLSEYLGADKIAAQASIIQNYQAKQQKITERDQLIASLSEIRGTQPATITTKEDFSEWIDDAKERLSKESQYEFLKLFPQLKINEDDEYDKYWEKVKNIDTTHVSYADILEKLFELRIKEGDEEIKILEDQIQTEMFLDQIEDKKIQKVIDSALAMAKAVSKTEKDQAIEALIDATKRSNTCTKDEIKILLDQIKAFENEIAKSSNRSLTPAQWVAIAQQKFINPNKPLLASAK